jgi:hypothetical protein
MNLTHHPRPLSAKKNSPCRLSGPATSQPDARSQLARRIQLLVNAACAARAGAAQMTLSDWRDVEQEVKRKLENEYSNYAT